MAELLSEEREVKLIVMWLAQPELYEVISKEYSNIIKRKLVVLAYIGGFGLCPRSALLRFRLSLSPLTTRHIIS